MDFNWIHSSISLQLNGIYFAWRRKMSLKSPHLAWFIGQIQINVTAPRNEHRVGSIPLKIELLSFHSLNKLLWKSIRNLSLTQRKKKQCVKTYFKWKRAEKYISNVLCSACSYLINIWNWATVNYIDELCFAKKCIRKLCERKKLNNNESTKHM